MPAPADSGRCYFLHCGRRTRRANGNRPGHIRNAARANDSGPRRRPEGCSTVVRDAVKAGNLNVEAAVYDLGSGKVTLG